MTIAKLAAALSFSAALIAAPASAAEPDAAAIVKAMSDYLGSQTNFTVQFEIELDIITPELEKIQFTSTGNLVMSRPDKLHVVRIGGYTEVELTADGRTFVAYDRGSRSYAQIPAPGSIDQTIDLLRSSYGVEMPGADLLLTNSYAELMAGVLEAKHIGVGIIDGVVCEHLAFRNADTDWQLWVRTGDQPLPCKYLISSKTMASAPEYSVRFHNWTSGQPAPASTFVFSPPPGSQQVVVEQLEGISELHAPADAGGQ